MSKADDKLVEFAGLVVYAMGGLDLETYEATSTDEETGIHMRVYKDRDGHLEAIAADPSSHPVKAIQGRVAGPEWLFKRD